MRPAYVCSALLAVVIATTGCRSDSDIATEHRRAIASFEATTVMAGEAWLSGTVSQTYVRATLETTARLLDERRAELSSNLTLLATSDGASLSQSEEQLSRTLAALVIAVDARDAAAARRCLEPLRRSAATG
jgi:uncharacterized tellurite resistance protein B-like protein